MTKAHKLLNCKTPIKLKTDNVKIKTNLNYKGPNV